MKVLHIVTTEESPFFQQKIEWLQRYGVNCDVVSATKGVKSSNQIPSFDGLPIEFGHNLPFYGFSAMKFYPRVLKRAIKVDDYDLLHAHSGLTAPFAVAQPVRPMVATLRGSDLLGSYMFGYYGKLLGHLLNQFDDVIVKSEEMRVHLSRDATVIPDGVDLDIFEPMSQRKALAEVGWDPSEFNVLFPYNPEKKVKNYPLALNVIQEANEILDTKVTLQVVNGVPHDGMGLYMNAADVLLLCSDHEGSPNTVKEAMACNLPVVSTPVGDVDQRLKNVEPSGVAEPDSLSRELVSVLRENKRSNGRTMAEKVSIETSTSKLVQTYKKLV